MTNPLALTIGDDSQCVVWYGYIYLTGEQIVMMYPMCACPPLQFVLSRGRIMQWVKLLETITQLCEVWWTWSWVKLVSVPESPPPGLYGTVLVQPHRQLHATVHVGCCGVTMVN